MAVILVAFPFRGRQNHRSLAEGRVGPKSLLASVSAGQTV